MMNGRNNGKKLMAVRIVAHAFEIVRFQSLAFRKTTAKLTIHRSTS
jgi:ribosomal protein S7